MVNRSSRAVGALDPYRPRVNLPEGLPEIQRGSAGADDQALYEVGSNLSDVFGKIADREARIEGKRAGEIAGNDPNFRPDNSTTIKGESFQNAAIGSYLDQLDTKITRSTRQAYQDWAERPDRTPAQLVEAYDKIRDDVLTNDAFPEIQGRISAQIERARVPFEINARKDMFERQQDQRRGEIITKAGESGTTIARLAADNPNDPKVKLAIDAEVGMQVEAYNRAAANGDITKEAAAKLIVGVRRDAAMRIGVSRVEKLPSVTDVDASEKALDRDFSAGKLPGLNDDAYDTIKKAHQQRRNQLTTEGSRDATFLNKRLDTVIDREKQGLPISAQEIEDLRLTAARTPQGQAAYDVADRKRQIVQKLRGQSPEAIDAFGRMARTQLRAGGPVTAEQNDMVSFIDSLADERRKGIATAPLKEAERSGLLKVAPLDISNTEGLEANVARRVAEARAVAQHNAREPVYFDPDEVKRAQAVIAQGGEPAMTALGSIIRGAGRDAPAVLAEIGNGAPEFAHAGALMKGGLPQQKELARDVLEGVRLKAIPGAKLPSIGPAEDLDAYEQVFGKSLEHQPENQQRLQATARAVYAVRAARANIEPKSADATDLMKKIYQEVGGQVKVNGAEYGGIDQYRPVWHGRREKVILPQNVRQGRIGDVLGAISDLDLKDLGGAPVDENNVPIKAAKLQNFFPVLSEGKWQFAKNPSSEPDRKFLRGQDGKPWSVDVEQLLIRVRPRVPDAFLGGR